MFKIEYLMHTIEELLPSVRINIHILDDGYRIILERENVIDYEYDDYNEEREMFCKLLEQIKDLHILKICNGARYIIKVLVITKVTYVPTDRMLFIKTPVKTVVLDDIYSTDAKNIAKKLKIRHIENL